MSRDRFRYGSYDVGYTSDAPNVRHAVRVPEIPNENIPAGPLNPATSRTYLGRIRDAADDVVELPGILPDYSPIALGMNAVPFSDELVGLATDALTPADYDEAQRAAEQARYEASEAHPWSALTGSLGQAAITAPLSIAGPAAGTTMAARVANAMAPAAMTGAALGAAGGALTGAMRGEDATAGERVANAARGALGGAVTGGAIGTGVGALGAAGQRLATTRSALLGVPSRILGAGLTGAGYGLAATPDMSGREITDLPGLASEAPSNAAVGGAFGLGAGTIGEIATAIPRARNYVQHLFRRLPVEEGSELAPISAASVVPDEAIGEIQSLPGLESHLPAVAPEATTGVTDLNSAVNSARQNATINTGDIIEDFVRTGLRRDPSISRLQSLGMSDNEIRRAAARYGNNPRALVAAAREFDLLPMRPYDPAAEAAAVEALRTSSGANVQRYRDMLRNLDVEVSGASIADDIQSEAERLARSTSPASRRRAEMLRTIADDMRYGPGVRQQAGGALGESVTPPERSLTMPELIDELDRYSEDLSRAYSSATPSQDAEALMDVRRVLAGVRDRVAASEMSDLPGVTAGTNAAEDYARNNRAFQVSSALSGGNNGIPGTERRQRGQFTAMLGGLSGASMGSGPIGRLTGAALGYLGNSTAAKYLPSLIATANEGGFAGPATQAWPGVTGAIRNAVSETPSPLINMMTQNVDRILQTDPSYFGRLDGVLRGAASRGALASMVTYLASSNPEFAALVQRITPEQAAEQAAQAERARLADPLEYGGGQIDAPPIPEDDELEYGSAR